MNGAGDSPIYVVRGARPRPLPGGDTNRSSWRGSLIVMAIMFGWLILMFVLAVIASPNDPNRDAPVNVGLGLVVTPTDGWYSAAEVWDVGENAVSLQKAGSLVAFAAEEYSGSKEQLLEEQLSILDRDFDSYRALPASATTLAGDVAALVSLFTGVANSSRLEGEVVVATSAGRGIIMLAVAPQGQLSLVQTDLSHMLAALEVPR
jgi:hypothetical protein